MSMERTEGLGEVKSDAGIKVTRPASSQAFDALAETTEDVGRKAARVAKHARGLAQVGIECVRDGSVQLGGQARRATDMTVAYVKEEPVKAMLMAAAAGAALMTLLRLSTRSRDAR
jgi:hypothetical protein